MIAYAPVSIATACVLLAAPGRTAADVADLPGVEVIAGSLDVGDGRPAVEATIAGAGGLAVDAAGNLYFADIGHNRVRRVDAGSGTVDTVAGTGAYGTWADHGIATEVPLASPTSVALDPTEQYLYVTELVGLRLLRIDLARGEIAALAPRPSGFGQLVAVAVDETGVFVADALDGRVWHHDGKTWAPLVEERAALPRGIRAITVGADGAVLASEFFGHRVVRFGADGHVTTVAGTGRAGRPEPGGRADELAIGTPDGVAVTPAGEVYFSDVGNRRLCHVAVDGRLSIRSAAESERAWVPGALALQSDGTLWMSDVGQNRIFRIPPDSDVPEHVAGGGSLNDGGPAVAAALFHPGRLAIDERGNLYVSDSMQHRVRRVDAQTGRIASIVGTGQPGYNGDFVDARTAQLHNPAGLQVADGRLYIADYYNNRIRMVELDVGMISTIAGTGAPGEDGDGGPALDATLLNPHALALDRANDVLYFTGAVTPTVRRLHLETGELEHVPLDRRVFPTRRSLVMYGIAERDGALYLADGMRSVVWSLDAGTSLPLASRPDLDYPMDVAVARDGTLFVCDTRNNRVVRCADDRIEVVVEDLGRPRGIAFGPGGELYIADTFNNRVLRVDIGAAGPSDAIGVMRRVNSRPRGGDARRELSIEITDTRGQVHTRDVSVRRKRTAQGWRTRFHITDPDHMRGLDLLIHEEDASVDMWMYFPRNDRTVPVVTRGLSALATDFTCEDMRERFDLHDYDFRILESFGDEDIVRVEMTPRSEQLQREFGFSRAVGHVRRDTWLIVAADYFDFSNAVFRRYEVNDVDCVNGIWTPTRFTMSNLRASSRTEVTLLDVTYNASVPQDVVVAERLAAGLVTP